MTRQEAHRLYKVNKDVNLKLLASKQALKIKQRRAAFRTKVQKSQARAEAQVRSRGDTHLQDKFTDKQLKRRRKTIKRDIAKKRKLKYQQHGGDIALGGSIDKERWQDNFYSTNVWKFKIRGKNLMVGFLDGSIYLYFGVAKLFLGMTRAGSKGKYVWRKLREKSVAFIKIR